MAQPTRTPYTPNLRIASRAANEGLVLPSDPADLRYVEASAPTMLKCIATMAIDASYAREEFEAACPNWEAYRKRLDEYELWPPAPFVWIEYQLAGYGWGIAITAQDMKTLPDAERQRWHDQFRRVMPMTPDLFEQQRFVLSLGIVPERRKYPIMPPLDHLIFGLDHEGHLLQDTLFASAAPSRQTRSKRSFDDGETLFLIGPALECIGLMSCANIGTRDHSFKDGTSRHLVSRLGCPERHVFKTLTLKVKAKKGRPAHEIDLLPGQSGAGKSLHKVRGHPVRYTPERPGFGWFVGTWYHPHHVKGNRKYGQIEKDYRLEGGEAA